MSAHRAAASLLLALALAACLSLGSSRALDCSLVLCAEPLCTNPIPADPDNGICCPVCPNGVWPCPPNEPPVHCLVDPCQYAECPAHPDALCVSDYCGGCKARFFVEGKEVTDSCDCPVIGQLFTNCGSACPANCTTPYPFCTKQCVARCECPHGEVINEATNTCVPIKDCPNLEDQPPACPDGQVFDECGSACTATCEDPTPNCTLQCVPRCQCPQGTVLNDDNKCIDPKNCH